MQLDFCPNCFEKTQSSVCPRCNFAISAIQSSSIELKPGTVINNKYKIGRVIGIGGFGITYMGYDIEKQVRYAIKEYMPKEVALRNTDGSVVPTSSKENDIYKAGLDKFFDEANVLVNLLGNKSIVEVHDFVVANNTGYLIMEYLDGVNLKKLLDSRGTIESEFALNVLFDVARALKIVHSKGLLHRDISPENIMILKDGSVKIIDFGAARLFVGGKSKSLSLFLKHGFAPPEQYSTTGNQGPWTDIYALAATYYKLVTGVTLPDSLSRATADTVERLDVINHNIKPHVGKAIQKALALNYRDRYQDVENFMQALKVPDEPVEKEITPSKQITEKPKRRSFTQWLFGRTTEEPVVEQEQKHEPVVTAKPYVRIINGAVTIGLWELPENREIYVGRDSDLCSIIVKGSSISRRHCSVAYNTSSGKFTVEDLSSNGTYFSNGNRLAQHLKYSFDAGNVVMLATQEYIMELGVR